MFIDLTPEQHALRLKVRDYFNHLMTPELRLELAGRRLAQRARRPGPERHRAADLF